MEAGPARRRPRPGTSRRGLLAAGAAGAAALAAGWRALRPAALDLEPHPTVPGFRRAVAGSMSGGVPGPLVALLAVPGPPDPAREAAVEAVRADPRAALFDGPAPRGAVPIASFSDFNCPFCRVLTERLAVLDAVRPRRVRVTWHELPLLGEASEAAARAALAAGRQGAYPAMHARLMRAGLVPTSAYLAEVGEGLGLDPVRLLRDMGSAGIDAALRRSAALADVFALPGTPALVVGRTVVLGGVGERPLARLIEGEREGA